MTQATKSITLTVSHRYGASAERVFDAWLDPEKAGKFLFATPDGEMIRAEIDARVGGKFNFTDRRPDGDADHIGEYLEIDPPRRLVFVFSDSFSAQPQRIVIEIETTAGGSELTLVHEMSPDWAAHEDDARTGWIGILDGLEKAL